MEHNHDRTVHRRALGILKGKRQILLVAVVLMIVAFVILHVVFANSIYKAGGFSLKNPVWSKNSNGFEMACLKILHRLPLRMDFSDPETAPTISLSRSYTLQGNLRCFGRACSPMSPQQSIKNSCCETNIWRRRTAS